MTKSTITREWLQHQISAIEAVGITDSNTLAAFKLALAAIDSEPVAWLAIYHGEVYDEAIGITRSVVEAQADHFGWESALTEIIPLYRHAQQPVVDSEFIPKNLDKALGVVGVALPESKEEFNFQIERWIQRLIDRVIRYADEFQEQPAPVTTSEEHRQLRDLVMMVKMLCRTIRKYNPESQQAADYTAYLQKEGLISAADCLRGSDPKETDTEDRRG